MAATTSLERERAMQDSERRERLSRAVEKTSDAYFIEVEFSPIGILYVTDRDPYWEKAAEAYPEYADKIHELKSRVRFGLKDARSYFIAKEQFERVESTPAKSLLVLLTLSHLSPNYNSENHTRNSYTNISDNMVIRNVADILKLRIDSQPYNSQNNRQRFKLNEVVGLFLEGRLDIAQEHIQSLRKVATSA